MGDNYVLAIFIVLLTFTCVNSDVYVVSETNDTTTTTTTQAPTTTTTTTQEPTTDESHLLFWIFIVLISVFMLACLIFICHCLVNFLKNDYENAKYRNNLRKNFESRIRSLEEGSRVCSYLPSDELASKLHEDVSTLYEAVRRGARQSRNGPMLGSRNKNVEGEPYEWISYNEAIDRSVNIAHAFQKLGLPAGQETCIGIYAKNRPEWVIVEQASYAFSNVLVPLYETLGPDACAFIIDQAEIRLVVCDSLDKAKGLIKQHISSHVLQYLVVMEDELPAKLVEEAEAQGVKLMTFAELEQIGQEAPRLELQPPKPEDLATICYTPGTTGIPKGVMLSHANIIADGTALDFFKNTGINSDDVFMSFLPLAHMFERVMQSVVYTKGGRVGFFRVKDEVKPDDS